MSLLCASHFNCLISRFVGFQKKYLQKQLSVLVFKLKEEQIPRERFYEVVYNIICTSLVRIQGSGVQQGGVLYNTSLVSPTDTVLGGVQYTRYIYENLVTRYIRGILGIYEVVYY